MVVPRSESSRILDTSAYKKPLFDKNTSMVSDILPVKRQPLKNVKHLINLPKRPGVHKTGLSGMKKSSSMRLGPQPFRNEASHPKFSAENETSKSIFGSTLDSKNQVSAMLKSRSMRNPLSKYTTPRPYERKVN